MIETTYGGHFFLKALSNIGLSNQAMVGGGGGNQPIYLSRQSNNMTPPFFCKRDDKVSLRFHYLDLEEKDPEEDKFITVDLCCKAGTTSTSAPFYKKKIKILECGTPRK